MTNQTPDAGDVPPAADASPDNETPSPDDGGTIPSDSSDDNPTADPEASPEDPVTDPDSDPAILPDDSEDSPEGPTPQPNPPTPTTPPAAPEPPAGSTNPPAPVNPALSACCFASEDGLDTLCEEIGTESECTAQLRGVFHSGLTCASEGLVCDLGACCSSVLGRKFCRVLSRADCQRLDAADLAEATLYDSAGCCDDVVKSDCGPNDRCE